MTPAGGVLLVAAVALVRGLLVAAIVPPLHGVDEPAHFDYAQRLAEHRALPTPWAGCIEYSPEVRAAVEALVVPVQYRPERPFPAARPTLPDPRQAASRATRGCSSVAPYPPLYYATAAAAYLPLRTAPLFARLFAMRAVSILWGILAAVASFYGGLWLFGDARSGTQLGLLVALQPMLSFLFSTVNSDAALFAACAVALAALAAVRRTQSVVGPLVGFAGGALVAALSKPTLIAMLPALYLMAVAAMGPRYRASWLRAAVGLLPAATTALAWSISARLSGVERVVGQPLEIGIGRYLAEHVASGRRIAFVWHRLYWMGWGWVDTWLPPIDYLLIAAVLIAAAFCAALGWKRLDPPRRGLLAWGAAATLGALVALYVLDLDYLRHTGQPMLQGRYLLGLFPLHAAMLIAAYRAGAPRVDPGWSLVAFVATLDAASVLRALVRYHG